MVRKEIRDLIRQYAPITDDDLALLFSKFRRVEYAKGDIIIAAEKISGEVFLIESGLMRAYFWDAKGNEVTQFFGLEGDLFASMFCYFKGEPAYMQYEAVSDMVMHSIDRTEIEALCRQNLGISNLFRIICIEQLYCLERRCKIFGKDDALSRYLSLINARPQIVKEVPLKHIASYLGITQQSLSRLRASIKNV